MAYSGTGVRSYRSSGPDHRTRVPLNPFSRGFDQLSAPSAAITQPEHSFHACKCGNHLLDGTIHRDSRTFLESSATSHDCTATIPPPTPTSPMLSAIVPPRNMTARSWTATLHASPVTVHVANMTAHSSPAALHRSNETHLWKNVNFIRVHATSHNRSLTIPSRTVTIPRLFSTTHRRHSDWIRRARTLS